MKTLISETGGYRVYAALSQISNPAGYYSLKITSQWDTAQSPEQEQTRYETLLSAQSLKQYHVLLGQALENQI
jgi:hypothetical protein